MKKLFSGPVLAILFGLAVGVMLIILTSGGKQSVGPSTQAQITLAQCLTDNDATFYGAWWCPHCDAQKVAFGEEAMEFVNYVECQTQDRQMTSECQEAKIESFPTWEIGKGGERFTGRQSLLRLARAARCAYEDYDPNVATVEPLPIDEIEFGAN